MRYTSMMITTKKFQWRSKEKELVAFISDLGRDFHFSPIYTDAADKGFTMQSEDTGNKVDFSIMDVRTDSDGDIQYWLLEPTPESRLEVPSCRGIKVIIYND